MALQKIVPQRPKAHKATRLAIFVSLLLTFHFSAFTLKAQDTNTVFLHIDGSTFFIDNEYFGDRVRGYTLPGFVLQPKVEYRLSDKVTLKGGFHWLNYWGARNYPVTSAYDAYPRYDSISRPMHLLPWLQARIDFTPKLTLLLGCLDNGNHDLPMPLYNYERAVVGDPEAGLELMFSSPGLEMDFWTDWREFIWYRSPILERFTMGFSGKLYNDFGRWTLYLPLHFIAQHEGGQSMADAADSLPNNSNFNAAAGLGIIMYEFTDHSHLDFSCHAMLYHQHKNPTVPFTKGWGIYPEVKLIGDHWSFLASYWYGKDFVPLMGSWHFSNLSANTAGLTFDRTRVITLSARWKWSPFDKPGHSSCFLTLHGTLYHYLPSTGTSADGATHEYDHRNQFTIGVAFNFAPTITLF